MMPPLPIVRDLAVARWAELHMHGRLDALNGLEIQLAAHENRPSYLVTRISDSVLAEDQNADHLYGRQVQPVVGTDGSERKGAIELNPKLLVDGVQPYAAVEAYFHEERHAFQDLIADNPGQSE